jgi:diaminopropionate ammonia-lyase
LFINPLRTPVAGLPDADLRDAAAFRRHLPATPLRDATDLAAELGLSRLFIKDETARWGLNAFKITGASYALERIGARRGEIVAASAGNHGRAVAHAARLRGQPCRIYLPSDALPARVAAIRGEGAQVIRVDGSYEDAVALALDDARRSGALLVSDTSPPGPPDIPAMILQGYTRIFSEAAEAWDAPPDLVVVQGGVGGLVGAAAAWLRTRLPDATLVAAEPEGAACLRESARAGAPIALARTEPTSMVCLRCASPSAAAWPFIAAGVDAFVGVTDEETAAAVASLARIGIASGASGACGLAALTAVAEAFRSRRALLVVTEGP